MHQVVAYKRLKTMESISNHQTQKVVTVAYRRWSFTSGFNCKAFDWENFGDLDWWSLMRGAHGGSTVINLM